MLNKFNRSYRKFLLSYTLLSLVITSLSISSESFTNLKATQLFAQTRATNLVSLWPSRPQRRRRTSRGDNVCTIAPAALPGIDTATYIIWHDRPLFLWNYSGQAQDAELIVTEYEDSNKIALRTTVNLTAQKFLYDGEKALEPGKLYKWQLVTKSKSNNTGTIFQIMSNSERDKIKADLLALEQSLKAAKAPLEEIALKKANYFANYQIKHQTDDKDKIYNPWSDVLQSLYDIDNPSAQYTQLRKEYTEYFCE